MSANNSWFVHTAADEETPRRFRDRDLPDDERPVNRAAHLGCRALSTIEILALVLGVPEAKCIATELVLTYGDLSKIVRLNRFELMQHYGIGETVATRLLAAFELGRRVASYTPATRPKITCPGDCANLLIPRMAHLDQEELWIICLSTRNDVLDFFCLYRGSLNTSAVRVAEIFGRAISSKSAAVIIAHNHPSGDPAPSPEDVHITRQVRKAGEILDIEVLDHLIVAGNRFVSLKDRGLGFD